MKEGNKGENEGVEKIEEEGKKREREKEVK
jgi:hypothetical protein